MRRLGLERLEDRRVMAASYRVEIRDSQNLVSSEVESQMRSAANFVMDDLARYVDWKGTVDVLLNVLPPLGLNDGITPSILQTTPDRRNATVYEMQTGVDLYPNSPDAGMTVHLGDDGTVKLYGMKAYFDPNPISCASANVPRGYFDFIGVLRHEISHSIAFQWGTNDFSKYVVQTNGAYYFKGPETLKVLGQPLPMSTFGGTHYGNYLLSNDPVKSGLMYQWGNYGGNRLDWGKLDLAVLKDVGLNVKSTAGLPLVDRMDSLSPRLVVSSSFVNENLPAGTTVATLSSSAGSGYTFEFMAGWDEGSFRISGNTLVTNASFDYETRSSYTIYVRMVDSEGVWTHSKLVVRVGDVREPTTLSLPGFIWAGVGAATMNGIRITGDSNVSVTFSFVSRNGSFEHTIRDTEVRVYMASNPFGGFTLSLTGTPAALTRNFKNVFYRGKETSILIQYADGTVRGDSNIRLQYSKMI